MKYPESSTTKSNVGRGSGGANKPTATAAAPGAPGSNKLKEYWQTLIYEWRKITWPEKKQWKDSTIVVFVFTIVLMIILAAFDWGVGSLMNTILGLGSAS